MDEKIKKQDVINSVVCSRLPLHRRGVFAICFSTRRVFFLLSTRMMIPCVSENIFHHLQRHIQIRCRGTAPCLPVHAPQTQNVGRIVRRWHAQNRRCRTPSFAPRASPRPSASAPTPTTGTSRTTTRSATCTAPARSSAIAHACAQRAAISVVLRLAVAVRRVAPCGHHSEIIVALWSATHGRRQHAPSV